MEAIGGQLGVEAAVQLTQDLGQFLLVLAEQQRLQGRRDLGVAEGLHEGVGEQVGADRVAAARLAQARCERIETQAEHLQRSLVAARDGFGQALAGEVEVEFVLAHQAKRRRRLARARASAEIVEAASDQLAVAHDVAGPALAQRQHRHQVLAVRGVAADAEAVVQLLFDRPVQAGRNRAELLDADALELLEQACRVGRSVCRHFGMLD